MNSRSLNRPPSLYADDLFDEIVALSPADRDAALVDRCAGDESLAAEVRALLEAHEAASDDDPYELAAGDELGPYRLHVCLGSGSSAAVWQAFDTRLETWTALKLIHPRIGRAKRALAAVMNEARSASGIISDHVVRVKNAGLLDDLHYIDMELCAEHRPTASGREELVVGRTLADEPAHDQDEAVRLVMEAARGVDAAHRIGVLHRDIKPANILVMPVSRRALVADFGLSAPQLHPPPGPSTPGTATVTVFEEKDGAVLVGTPCFMPPEQAYGNDLTRASDVYSLGATLYALLSGMAPYESIDEPRLHAMQVVVRVRAGPPRALRDVRRKLPPRLCRIVDKAMARSPRRRYPTAGALADDLALYLAERPTSVDGQRPVLWATLAVRRNVELAVATVFLACMLLVFGGAVWALNTKKNSIEDDMRVAEARRDDAELRSAEADHRRVQAERERMRAMADAEVASDARQRAEGEARDSEQRALFEIEQRRIAEENRQLAEEAQEAAQDALEDETTHRLEVQAGLRVATERAAREEQARAAVESLLQAETAARLRAEHERQETERVLAEADGRVQYLQSELSEARAENETLLRELQTLRADDGPPEVEVGETVSGG